MWRFSATTLWHFDAEEQGPSTPSFPRKRESMAPPAQHFVVGMVHCPKMDPRLRGGDEEEEPSGISSQAP